MNNDIDLEDDIQKVWTVKDDIELLIWRYVDHPKHMNEDEVWNHLAGIASRLDLYCEKLWDTYCKKFELDDYATPEKLAYRAEFLKGIREAADRAEKATKKKGKKK
jgi:hypothetical protein